jgi:hypothetical protein
MRDHIRWLQYDETVLHISISFFSHIHLMQFDFTRIIHLPKHDDLMRLCQVASADSTLAHPTSYNSSCTCIVLHTGTSWSFHMVIPHGLPNGITNGTTTACVFMLIRALRHQIHTMLSAAFRWNAEKRDIMSLCHESPNSSPIPAWACPVELKTTSAVATLNPALDAL